MNSPGCAGLRGRWDPPEPQAYLAFALLLADLATWPRVLQSDGQKPAFQRSLARLFLGVLEILPSPAKLCRDQNSMCLLPRRSVHLPAISADAQSWRCWRDLCLCAKRFAPV